MNRRLIFGLLVLFHFGLYAKNSIISLDLLSQSEKSSEKFIKTTKLALHDLPYHLKGNEAEKLNVLLEYIETSKKLIILKFYADWCKPCSRMKPMIESIAESFNDQIAIITINVDNYALISAAFKIRYIPTLVFIQDGQELMRTNSITKNEMTGIIHKFLS
jgi:thioredoxin